MRGDFASTRIKIPFHPISQVSLQYTGCADTCDYWVNYIYDTGHKTVPGFATRDEAIAACQGNSADGFWRGLFTCYKKAAATINGCISLDSCLSALPNPGSSGKLCDHAQDVPLNVRVKVDPAYVGSDTYGPLIANANGRLKVGAIAQNATSGTWMALPGTYQDFVYGKTDYALSLAYMPLVPNDFMQIANINGVQQSQMYIAIFDLDAHTGNATPYGEGLYPKNDVVTQGDWFYLLVYSYNWTDPEQEGWTLGFVSGSTIYGWANPYETIVDLTFGDLRVTGTTILQP